MKKSKALWIVAFALSGCTLSACSEGGGVDILDTAVEGPDRADIRVVGSSTIYPFAEKVRDAFQAGGGAPVTLESTGTGAGQAQFCQGRNMDTPDIVNSSRPQAAYELEACKKNGVKDIIEVKFGFDGIVVAQSRSATPTAFSINTFYQALAKTLPTSNYDCTPTPNPNTKWSDIDPALPDAPIVVYGPPATSGTRDVFVQIAMEAGAKRIACLDAMSNTEGEEEAFAAAAHTIRDDGAWIDSGEDDNAIVSLLDRNRQAYGVFGYSFLEKNPDVVQSATINGAEPTFENIASGKYKLARPLYFYIKTAHIARLPAIKDYALQFLSEEAAGDSGYLREMGLVPLPAAERAAYRQAIEAETNDKP